MAQIVVLGAGLVGAAIAVDLHSRHTVTACDRDADKLARLRDHDALVTRPLDVTDHNALAAAIGHADLVISAVPGFLGFETLRAVIEQGKPVVDIAFCPENTLELNRLAKEKGVTAVVDAGVAPGLSHLILGYYSAKFDVDDFECLVGGLPKVRTWPSQYKAPFSPVDVIEEYLRPARLKENGQVVTKPALTDRQLVHFDQIGTLEAFNTDGLRTLLTTMPQIPNMKEKTLRYPGHLDFILALKKSGFFDQQPLDIGGHHIPPLTLTSSVLFHDWRLDDEDPEFTVMRVTLAGETASATQMITYHLYDEYDPNTRTSSMARTTGYTCSAMAELILSQRLTEKGVFPPELVGRDGHCFRFVMDYLAERNVRFRKETSEG